MFTFFKLKQPKTISLPIFAFLLGTERVSSFLQSSHTVLPTLTTESGQTQSLRLTQSLNALSPITCNVSGNTTLSISVPLNALSSILITPDGTFKTF